MVTNPNPNSQPPKKWWQSKTIWTGLLTLGYGVATAFGLQLPPGVAEALIGLGLITARVSTAPVKK